MQGDGNPPNLNPKESGSGQLGLWGPEIVFLADTLRGSLRGSWRGRARWLRLFPESSRKPVMPYVVPPEASASACVSMLEYEFSA